MAYLPVAVSTSLKSARSCVSDWAAEQKLAAGAGLAQLLADKEKQCDALQVAGQQARADLVAAMAAQRRLAEELEEARDMDATKAKCDGGVKRHTPLEALHWALH